MAKITPVPYARGTKLATGQLTGNLNPAVSLLATPSTDTTNVTHNLGRFTVSIPVVALQSRLFEFGLGRFAVPVPLPPLQDEWEASLVAGVNTPRPNLKAVSISFNQRGEGYGIGDTYSGATDIGKLTDTDMSRYDIGLQFIEKPLSMTTTGLDAFARNFRTIWETTLSGPDLLALPDATPLLKDSLNETLDPYSGHWLIVTAPGMFTADPAQEQCCIPNLLVVFHFERILVQRDSQAGIVVEVQNLPLFTLGQPQPTTITPTVPASNAVVTQAHTQDNYELVDAQVAAQLEAGWQAHSTLPVSEQTTVDSSYSVIAIPLWAGYEDLRASEVPTRGLPYTSGPGWLDPTADRRLAVIPDGFVVHHCMLWRSMAGYACPTTGGNVTNISQVTTVDFHIEIGLGLVQGWHSENYRYQQVAYLDIVGGDLNDNQVDVLGQTTLTGNLFDGQLHYIPLVHPAAAPSNNGFYTTGVPVYIGRGARRTVSRTGIAPTPSDPGAYITPVTTGQETHVEARWVMEDAVNGLDFAGTPDAIRLGYGGGILYIIGKMPLASQDTKEV